MGASQSNTMANRSHSKTLGRRKSSADTIGDIRRAAAGEFAKFGFDCATVEGIARKANVSKQLLYYYFGNKAELYSLILDEAAKQSPEIAHEIDLEALTASRALTTFMDIIFSDYERRPCTVRMTMDEAQHGFRHVGKNSALAEGMRRSIDTLGRILARGTETGEFRSGLDADALFWAIFSLATNWFTHSPMLALVSGDDFAGERGLEFWRQNSAQLILNAIAHPMPGSFVGATEAGPGLRRIPAPRRQ